MSTVTVLVPLAALIFCFTAFGVCDNDIGYHLTKGRFFLEQRRLASPDEFLCSGYRGLDFLDRWGFQIVVHIIHAALGLAGLIAARMLLVALAFVLLVFVRLDDEGRPLWLWRGLVAVLAMLVCYERFNLRGEVFYHLFALGCFIVPALYCRGRCRRLIWVLPVVQLAWVNMHGTFIFGPAILGAFVLGEALSDLLGRRKVPARPAVGAQGDSAGAAGGPPEAGVDPRLRRSTSALTAVFALSIAASFANPRGLDGLLLPVKMMFRMFAVPWYQQSVAELVPTFSRYEEFRAIALPAFVALIALAALSVVLNRRNVRAGELFVALFTLALSVAGRRNIGFFGFVGSLCLVANGEQVLKRLGAVLAGRFGRGARITGAVAGRVALVLVAGLLCMELVSGGFYVAERSDREFGFGPVRATYPVEAVSFLVGQSDRGGGVFTNWDAGSYLLWRAFPRFKPYINSEGDYSLELLSIYRRIMSGAVPYQPELDRLGIDTVLLRHRSEDTKPLIARLWRDKGWRLVFWDDVGVVFFRTRAQEPGATAGPATEAGAAVETRLEELASRDEGLPAGRTEEGGFFRRIGRYFDHGARFRAARKHLFLAGLMDAMGFRDLERRELLRALDLYPDFPEALNNLGVNLAVDGETADAKLRLRKALAVQPGYVNALRNLGTVFLQEGNRAQAIETYLEALCVNPRDRIVPTLLARTYLSRDSEGDSRRAVEALEAAIERDRDNIAAHELLVQIFEGVVRDAEKAEFHRGEARRARDEAHSIPAGVE
ncbi:MAG: tetratricopeptide repeat protein [Planctomycetota bacterium]|nr:tetratricopeptide repeat protein [Planctomycetota bacterium]